MKPPNASCFWSLDTEAPLLLLRAAMVRCITVLEKYWEERPGQAVPLMKPKFYSGPWKVMRGETLPPAQ